MIAITLNQAKAKLNHLVEQAQLGEQVVLLRGSKIVATIFPITDQDVELSPHLSDAQAQRFWNNVSKQKSKKYANVTKLVKTLSPKSAK